MKSKPYLIGWVLSCSHLVAVFLDSVAFQFSYGNLKDLEIVQLAHHLRPIFGLVSFVF